jgi:hypothetical protein
MTMNNHVKLFVITLALLSVSSVFGQVSFDYFGDKWVEYLQRTERDLVLLHHNHFNDSVDVAEMKEAFFKNKDQRFKQSPFEGFDSVVHRPLGAHVMLLSPLRRHPQKEIRECRGVWSSFGGFSLLELLDKKDGTPQQGLFEKLNSDKTRKWLDGEVITLRTPRWYMGFVVSPSPHSEIYEEGKLVGRASCGFWSTSDFFSFASLSEYVLYDGDWDDKVSDGAKLLGVLHGIRSSANLTRPERTFSVLLYEKPKAKDSKVTYTLELLEPEKPDEVTTKLFQNFKGFVERIPAKAFMPYYTTDFRIMTGRYYRVTVNKCGWLVEDYFSINK